MPRHCGSVICCQNSLFSPFGRGSSGMCFGCNKWGEMAVCPVAPNRRCNYDHKARPMPYRASWSTRSPARGDAAPHELWPLHSGGAARLEGLNVATEGGSGMMSCYGRARQ
jgi:hypothetical protein